MLRNYRMLSPPPTLQMDKLQLFLQKMNQLKIHWIVRADPQLILPSRGGRVRKKQMFVIRCPEQSLKFGDSPAGGVWVQRLSPTDPILELQPKDIQLNCNKAFWKRIFALSATRFTRIFHEILLSSLIQITSKELFAPGFAPRLTYLYIYYLLTSSAPSCKPPLWNINYRTVWLESKGFTYINPT